MKRLLILVLFLFPIMALAQVASPTPGAPAPYVPPQYLTDILNWIQGLPKVGPIAVAVLLGLGLVATLMTLLSTFLLGVKESIKGVAKLAGAVAVIDKVEEVYQKIAPYVMWLSMYNVQKKQDPPKT